MYIFLSVCVGIGKKAHKIFIKCILCVYQSKERTSLYTVYVYMNIYIYIYNQIYTYMNIIHTYVCSMSSFLI